MRTYGSVIETLGGPRFVPGEEARVQVRLTASQMQSAALPEEIDISGYVGRMIMFECDQVDDAWAWGGERRDRGVVIGAFPCLDWTINFNDDVLLSLIGS